MGLFLFFKKFGSIQRHSQIRVSVWIIAKQTSQERFQLAFLNAFKRAVLREQLIEIGVKIA